MTQSIDNGLDSVMRRERLDTAYWDVSSLLEEGVEVEVDGHNTAAGQATTEAIQDAAELLRQGGIVAFPTETVYGLGADARSTTAVEAVFAAKGRPADNPLIVHIADRSQLAQLITEIPPVALTLMDAYWPGPLTIVLPLRPDVLSPRVTAGLDTVGIRMPDHPIALALIAAADCPIAAPSANRSGRPSPTLASHVLEDLAGRIDGVLDGGPAGVGLESTVVRVFANGEIHVLRPGGITIEQLSLATDATVISAGGAVREARSALSLVLPASAVTLHSPAPGNPQEMHHVHHEDVVESEAPRSPGVKYAHYAPQGELTIVRGTSSHNVASRISILLAKAVDEGKMKGLLAFDEHIPLYDVNPAIHVISLGSLANLAEAAHKLYAALRIFDELDVDYILTEACSEEGLGEAVMNRLIKAAGGKVIELGD